MSVKREGLVSVAMEATDGGMRARQSSPVFPTDWSPKRYSQLEIDRMVGVCKKELGDGQGVVYLDSLLESGGKAAVKFVRRKISGRDNLPDITRLVNNHNQEPIEEDLAELIRIQRLHHRNLVPLLCLIVAEDDLYLVYESTSKGSLSENLHSVVPVLDWNARMNCAIGVAHALHYLHSYTDPPLVHGDIKSSNILLDDNMNAKIADLGLAKLVVYEGVSERVCGSSSYQDPVYLGNGQPCDKDDVYSYGEVLVELITGKPACKSRHRYRRCFLKKWDYLRSQKTLPRLRQVVDKGMDPSKVNWDQVYEVAKIACDCLKKTQQDRPSMKDVVLRLRNATSEKMATSPKLRSIRVPCGQFGSNGGYYDASNNSTPIDNCFPKCDKEWNSVTVGRSDEQWNSLTVGCTVAGRRITVRCKIWPTSKSLGLNKVEAKVGPKLAWKCHLWVWNREDRREIEIGDNMKVTAEWHVTGKRVRDYSADRSQGPFCIKYLSIKDEKGIPLVFFNGDEWPQLEPTHLHLTDSGEIYLGKVIGRGGYGTVREGKWRGLDVAVKHYKCREAEDLVKTEGGMLKRLEHSKVVKLYACAIHRADSNKGDIEGMLVMERMDHDLRTLIEQRRAQSSKEPPFTLRAGLDIMSQIAEGMRHLKLCRVLHRDLKASNVLVKLKPGTASEIDTCYEVKLSDFGISKFDCSTSFFTTKEVGVLPWRAPEVFKDQDAPMITKYTWSSDVYSFGMTCFEILTGEVPFPRISAEELYKIICLGERPTLPQNSPPDLVKLIEECWLTDPMKRPNFDDICRRLSLLKEEFLKTS